MKGLKLHVTRDFPPRWGGGISTALWGIVSQERAQGCSIDVVSFDAWRPRRALDYQRVADGPSTHEPAAGSQGALRVWRVRDNDDPEIVARLIRQNAYSLVEVHHPMLWRISQDAAAVVGTPAHYMAHVLSTAMDVMRGLQTPTQSSIAEQEAVSEAEVVIAPSRWAAQELAELRGTAPLQVRQVPLLDGDFAELGADAERPWTFAYLARFSDLKQSELAVGALFDALARLPEARAVIVGGLPENPKSERKLLERWRVGQPDDVLARVDFVGWKSRPETLEIMAQSRVFFTTSAVETWGLALAEARRCGCVLVASDLPPHREQEGDASTTRWLSPNAPRETWAHALICAADH